MSFACCVSQHSITIILQYYDRNVMSDEGWIMAVETERVALVTGASSGIGEAAGRALVDPGFTVYGTSRKAVAGGGGLRVGGGSGRAVGGGERDGVVFLPLDVTDDASVGGVVHDVLRRSGR